MAHLVKIAKIERAGKRDVYNMEVEDHHNFSVNGGLLVHNCIDAIRYATEDACERNEVGIASLADYAPEPEEEDEDDWQSV
jgi:hypothetical protein